MIADVRGDDCLAIAGLAIECTTSRHRVAGGLLIRLAVIERCWLHGCGAARAARAIPFNGVARCSSTSAAHAGRMACSPLIRAGGASVVSGSTAAVARRCWIISTTRGILSRVGAVSATGLWLLTIPLRCCTGGIACLAATIGSGITLCRRSPSVGTLLSAPIG